MGMTAFYTTDPVANEPESLRTFAKVIELSAPEKAFIDTAWIYVHPSGLETAFLFASWPNQTKTTKKQLLQ